MKGENDEQTFKKEVGNRILPKEISVVFSPHKNNLKWKRPEWRSKEYDDQV